MSRAKTKKAYSTEKMVRPNLFWPKSGPAMALPPTTAMAYAQTRLSLSRKYASDTHVCWRTDDGPTLNAAW